MWLNSISKGIAIALIPAFFTSVPVFSQTADFTFKRVKVDPNRKGPRMNIQIEPKAEEPKPEPEVIATPDDVDLQDWFWSDVSPDLAKADINRMNVALAKLQAESEKNAALKPRLDSMQGMVNKFGKDILVASLGKQVSPAFLLAIISVESGGRVDATSSAGAQGLMQLIPATAKRFNVDDPTDPVQNITGGAAYLEWLLAEFRHDPLLALAAYNAGENAVKRHEGVPPYAETRAYVPKVVAAWQVARMLCKTPPMGVSDPCVFNIQ
ncbi:murein transglycosylase [Amylibacter ulvae]|uniref:Murein transglycosylase n=1 Tax=Paramylibacter ulvae TaxID=1651968 RepID=A0ABQ3D0H9_9RHOB|nr:lytic transglycosylase domain-containing protein [Amylibacter ulvae]GHA50787.1 murein transglycosylase [Amylibacter ulvae]